MKKVSGLMPVTILNCALVNRGFKGKRKASCQLVKLSSKEITTKKNRFNLNNDRLPRMFL